jgi:hypothetical protein
MDLDPTFYDVFAAYFNVDSLEPDDRQQLRNLASAAASALKTKVTDPGALSAGLSRFLRTWDHDTIMKLIRYTNVDWLADEDEKENLRYVINEIIKNLK